LTPSLPPHHVDVGENRFEIHRVVRDRSIVVAASNPIFVNEVSNSCEQFLPRCSHANEAKTATPRTNKKGGDLFDRRPSSRP